MITSPDAAISLRAVSEDREPIALRSVIAGIAERCANRAILTESTGARDGRIHRPTSAANALKYH